MMDSSRIPLPIVIAPIGDLSEETLGVQNTPQNTNISNYRIPQQGQADFNQVQINVYQGQKNIHQGQGYFHQGQGNFHQGQGYFQHDQGYLHKVQGDVSSHTVHHFPTKTTQQPQSNQHLVDTGQINLLSPGNEKSTFQVHHPNIVSQGTNVILSPFASQISQVHGNATIPVQSFNIPVQHHVRLQSNMNVNNFFVQPTNGNIRHIPPVNIIGSVWQIPLSNPVQSSTRCNKPVQVTSQKQSIPQNNVQVPNTDIVNECSSNQTPVFNLKSSTQSNEVIKWSEIDNIKFPCVFRKEGKFVSVRIAEIKFLSKFASNYPSEITKQPPLKSQPITRQEAKMLDVINKKANYEYGLVPFRKELIVDLEQFKQFYSVIKESYEKEQMDKKTLKQQSNQRVQSSPVCVGWLQINNTVIPYILRSDEKYIPLCVIKYAAELEIGDLTFSVLSTSDEIKQLNECCKSAGLNFSFDSDTGLVTLSSIIQATTKSIVIKDLPLNNPFAHATYDPMFEEDSNATGNEVCGGETLESNSESDQVAIVNSSEMQVANTNKNSVSHPPCDIKLSRKSLKISAPVPMSRSNSCNSVLQASHQEFQSTLKSKEASKDKSISNKLPQLHSNSKSTCVKTEAKKNSDENLNLSSSKETLIGLCIQKARTRPILPKTNVKPIGKVSSVTIDDTTVLVIKRMDGHSYALLESLYRIFCSVQVSISEFIDTVEKVVPVKPINCTKEEANEFIRIYNLQTDKLRCRKIIQIDIFQDYLPLLHCRFQQGNSKRKEFSSTENNEPKALKQEDMLQETFNSTSDKLHTSTCDIDIKPLFQIIDVRTNYDEDLSTPNKNNTNEILFPSNVNCTKDNACLSSGSKTNNSTGNLNENDITQENVNSFNDKKPLKTGNKTKTKLLRKTTLFPTKVNWLKRNINRNSSSKKAFRQNSKFRNLSKTNEISINTKKDSSKHKHKGMKRQKEADLESEKMPVKKCKLCLIDIVKENLCYEICKLYGITFIP